jgi:hypothetical protein
VSGENRAMRKFIIYTLHHILGIRVIKLRRMRWTGYVARRRHGKFIIQKSERKTPIGRLGCRWENNILMDLRTIRRTLRQKLCKAHN